jgi:predicted kinase
MPTCYIMVGLPASGKSTCVIEMCAMDPDAYVYSTDDIVEDIAKQLGKTYDEVWEKHVGAAKLRADIWLAEAMKNKQDVIWDQTNLGAGKRKGIINRMRKAGYGVECLCFLQPETEEDIAEWNKRLQSRPGKNIPDFIIKNMVRTFVVPTVDEGLDSVLYYNMHRQVQTM